MRQEFARLLYEEMLKNDKIWLLVADLGFGLFDKIEKEFPDRFVNTGASEQACSDICVGLALSGKIPFIYSITPFLLYRCMETWRTYINHEVINIKLIGSGRDNDYGHDGFSHDATDIYHFLDGFSNIGKYYPEEAIELKLYFNNMLNSKNPSFMSLTR